MEDLELGEEVQLEDLPLAEVFRRASALANQAESLPPGPDTNAQLRRGAAWLRHASGRVASLALFSANEGAEDIPTSDLKYLLTPFHTAELLAAISSPADPAERAAAVEEATAAYAAFLTGCDRYDLLGEGADEAHAGAEERVPMDPTSARAAKIARFKREKALKAQLEELARRRMAGMRAAALADDDEDGGDASGGAGMDEEDERVAWVAQIELAVLRALDARRHLAQEAELLAHAVALPPGERAVPRPPAPPELVAELRKVAGSLGAQERDRARAAVFRPGHSLPTMSLRELGEMEAADAMRRQASEAEAEAAAAAQAAVCEEGECEEEVRRQRAWDDWADENPRGAGNSKLTPCG
eukprot:jgi/Tetstr1/445703/TSEL_003502.t1